MEWVRGLGDAYVVEDKLVKKVNDLETNLELCHNVLEKRVSLLGLDIDRLRHSHKLTEDMSINSKNMCHLMMDKYCEIKTRIETDTETQRNIFNHHLENS